MLVNLIEKINKNLFGFYYFGLMQLMKDEFLVNSKLNHFQSVLYSL